MLRSTRVAPIHPAVLSLLLLTNACDVGISGLTLGSGGGYGYGRGYTFTGLTVEPLSVEHVLGNGDSVSFKAYWTEEGGPREPIDASWTSADTSLVWIADDGVAEPRIPGSVGILARARGWEVSARMNILLGQWSDWPGSMRLASVSAGGSHTCGRTASGDLHCWGGNHASQIAPVTRASMVYVPRSSSTTPAFRTLSSGPHHVCGLTGEDTAYCWGLNRNGALGTGSPEEYVLEPTPLANETAFEQIFAGWEHTCGLDRNGRAYCWGRNDEGQLATENDSPWVTTPSPLNSELRFSSLDLSGPFTCGVSTEGDLVCWGWIPGRHDPRASGPEIVSDDRTWSSVATGDGFICAVDVDGRAHCLGDHQVLDFRTSIPRPLEGDLIFDPRSLSMPSQRGSACALTPSQEAYCWGELPGRGDRPVESSLSPVRVAGGHRFSQLSVGTAHACGIRVEGDLLCWGVNHSGQLGTGRTDSGSDEPVRVKGQPEA